MTTDDTSPSETVLEETPGRALALLRGIAQNPVVHGLLASAGFTAAEYARGWQLVHASAGYQPAAAAPPTPERTPAFVAMETLDAWDEDGLRRIRAALGRLHAAQGEFVFRDGLAASSGPQSVVGVATLLERLDALESSKDRKATRKDDHAALETLAARGIDKAERQRLGALVATAQRVATPAPVIATTGPAERHAALLELYRWYKDWSETAHSVIKKRAHLITLGLAKRRPPAKKQEDAPK